MHSTAEMTASGRSGEVGSMKKVGEPIDV